jgi:arsenate reductase (thioredoxin)
MSPTTERIVQCVVFACVHNAGRSQMAAAWFNALTDPSRARAVSAGTRPGDHVHPVVVDAMREVDIDLSAATPRLLTREIAAGAALLVTMGCGEECPFIPGVRREDWPLDDPRICPSSASGLFVTTSRSASGIWWSGPDGRGEAGPAPGTSQRVGARLK